MSERRAVIRAAAAGYRKASKKRQGQWLDELVALTGYHRWYVVRLLRAHGRTIRGAGRIRLVADVELKARRGRRPVYDETDVDVLENLPSFIEEVYNEKRLHSGIDYLTPSELEEQIRIDPSTANRSVLEL